MIYANIWQRRHFLLIKWALWRYLFNHDLRLVHICIESSWLLLAFQIWLQVVLFFRLFYRRLGLLSIHVVIKATWFQCLFGCRFSDALFLLGRCVSCEQTSFLSFFADYLGSFSCCIQICVWNAARTARFLTQTVQEGLIFSHFFRWLITLFC